MNSRTNYSNFWFDRQTSIVDDLLADDVDDVKVKPQKDHIQLAANQRAIDPSIHPKIPTTIEYARPVKKSAGKNKTAAQARAVTFLGLFSLIEIKAKVMKRTNLFVK